MRSENERHLDVERPRLAITANDDAIGHALEALDCKLDAWLAALMLWHDRHSGEADASPRSPDGAATRTNQPDSPAQAGPTTVTRESKRKEGKAPAPHAVQPSTQACAPAQAEAPDGASAAGSRDVVQARLPVGDETVGPAACDSGGAAASSDEAIAPSAPAVDEDEALLATLDPETARAIRVMRRLSDNKRSVRDLLAEMEANKTRPKPIETRRKSWWR